ncbi:MAG: DUF1617 family protein [Streptococcaceae bacterium]|nr:DUF1617 family protein [Streptococcaceae bacterium]
MINFKNRQLIPILNYLSAVELQPKASRVRTKLKALLMVKIEDMTSGEMELLEKFGVKDSDGKLVENDGGYTLVPETAQSFHQEKAILLDEEIQINVVELKERLPNLIKNLEASDITLSGEEAEAFDLLLDALEREVG